jgi:phosphoribosylformylglycinamidine cyclo-ligase/phosphoribosylamine--glycine ligase/phosphoribosylglycinamide formyltransferase/phosphoribosylformylglycinamidine cyclo-ligase
MRRAFNGGVGMLLAVAAEDAEAITVALNDAGEDAFICGEIVAK